MAIVSYGDRVTRFERPAFGAEWVDGLDPGGYTVDVARDSRSIIVRGPAKLDPGSSQTVDVEITITEAMYHLRFGDGTCLAFPLDRPRRFSPAERGLFATEDDAPTR